MDIDHRKSKSKVRKDRIKTICTLDTYDANLADSYFNKENRNRNGPVSASHDRSNLRQTKKKSSHHHNKSQFSAFNQSRVKDNTPKSLIKRAMSITQDRYSRLKTDYSQYDQSGMHRILGSLKKKLIFPSEETSKLDDLHILRKFHQTEQEQFFQIQSKNIKTSKSVMIKTKSASIKKDYEMQMKLINSLVNVIKEKQQKVLLKIEKIIKDKKEWVIFTEHFYHACWKDDRFYLLLSRLKSNSTQLQIITRQLTQAICITSHNGYCHNGISLECLFFPIFKGSLKFETKLKIGNLLNAFQINSKQAFLSMPALYRTPPQILNFIMFEARQIFDRDSLQYISLLNEGWKIDVWAMGILILELLNGGPLAGQGSQMGQLIVLQKEILIRYSYLLNNMQQKLKLLLTKMLSPHPNERPHPRDILRIL